MVLAILGVVALGTAVYYGYTKLKAKVVPVVTQAEAVVTEVKAEVVTVVNAIESVTKSL